MSKLYEIAVQNPKITSKFGYRIHPIYKDKRFHYGIDIISKKKNLNLYAVADGYVQKVVTGQDKATTGYGNYLWIRYPKYNVSLLYAHCKKVLAKKGDKVVKGTIVAYMGSTGASTGTHLHLGATKIGSNTYIDPEPLTDDVKYNLTRLLKKGCTGEDVIKLQYALGMKTIDGIFGNDTLNAVKKYQKSKGLTADGVVGKNTAHSLGWLYQGK